MDSQHSSNDADKKQANNPPSNRTKKKQTNNQSSNQAKKKQANNRSSNGAEKKQANNRSSNGAEKKDQAKVQSALLPCLNGRSLELIVASLLLTGKLRVDAVQLFRQATMIVSLTGKYLTLDDLNNKNVDNMLKFLNDNGNVTVDEIFQAFKKKMES